MREDVSSEITNGNEEPHLHMHWHRRTNADFDTLDM
jgi:hypothetical protein